MPGIAEFALGAAPVAGGALLGIIAGNLKGPDFRGMIQADLDLLDRIPAEDVERRERLQASINRRIDDLIEAGERTRRLREAALSYGGSWRDLVVFVCAVLFCVVWFHLDHDRDNWLPVFVVLVALTVLAGLYALRGIVRAVRTVLRRGDHPGAGGRR
ncbi:hypothetical protein [uncultured Mycolicibacterium sp.]|uniref:hypothetical protein n=1 Tax=uncultured Mycolicibacterium sp. TaxID=2320817 RepID=UPI00260A1985|nr:hypothetical protein [uncultured Mycolicibacterium sp.]